MKEAKKTSTQACSLVMAVVGILSVTPASASSNNCKGTPLAAFESYQAAIVATTSFDDTQFLDHLSLASRKAAMERRSPAALAKQFKSSSAPPEARQAIYHNVFKSMRGVYPIEKAKTQATAPDRANVTFNWETKTSSKSPTGTSTESHVKHAATTTFVCEGGAWKVQQDEHLSSETSSYAKANDSSKGSTKANTTFKWPAP